MNREDAWAAANARWDARKPAAIEPARLGDGELSRDLARVDTLLAALHARGAARRRRRGLAALGVAAALVLSLQVSGAWSGGAVAPLAVPVEHAGQAQPSPSTEAPEAASPLASVAGPAASPRAPGRILSSRLAVERTVHLPAGWVSAGAHRGTIP